ncbi:MAG TPA: hypothetical protein VD766_12245 [Solirubrobacterales bacterium]|nr:hypothetical protein [Solirubrobacterales bacterium]
MTHRISSYLRQQHTGLLAVFIALSGTAYAVDGPNPGTNAVGSEDIINGEVKAADIGGGVVTGAKVLDDSLGNVDLKSGSVRTSEVANGSLTGGDILPESLTDANLGTDSVRADEIRYWSIGSEELALSSVGDAHLKTDSVRPDEIQADAVGSSEIAPDAVGSSEIGTNSVSSSELQGVGFYSETDTVQDRYATPVATCPDNHQLLSGGGEVISDTYQPHHVLDNKPEGNGWRYTVVSHNSSQFDVRAWVVCLAP